MLLFQNQIHTISLEIVKVYHCDNPTLLIIVNNFFNFNIFYPKIKSNENFKKFFFVKYT